MEDNHIPRPIIAITGSAGKTTTKELIACILSTRLTILKSIKNQNQSFTARYAKSIKPHHQAIVLEYGLRLPGDIKRHCSILQPDISVITNIGSAHVGNFNSSIVELAKAKSEIIEGMNPFGKLYLNADDSNSKYLFTDSFKGSIITIGVENLADYMASNINYCDSGMTFQIRLYGRQCTFMVPVYGAHNIYNALFSVAVTHQLGFTPEEIQQGFNNSVKYLKNMRRLSVYHSTNNIQIIDDTFSANPQAMKAALDVLDKLGKENKIAVLADMMELGDYTAEGHMEVGKYLATKKVDHLFTYGKFAKDIGLGAIQSGFPKEQVYHFNKMKNLNASLLKILIPGSTVLIKGSHSVRMNRTVKFLRSNLDKQVEE